jgi:hypothetical protein
MHDSESVATAWRRAAIFVDLKKWLHFLFRFGPRNQVHKAVLFSPRMPGYF